LLVVAHPLLTGIGEAEIDRVIPKSRRTAGFDFVEIAPLRTTLAEQYDLDWAALQEVQEQLFAEKLRPHLEGRQQMAYFGLAPIPLAIHLGYRVQSTVKIDVYQRHHDRQDWSWTPSGRASTRSFLEPIRLPERGSSAPGVVVIRVSTSARIAPEDTEAVVPQCLAAVDIAIISPHPDALETREALDTVVAEFSRTLTQLHTLFPNLTAIHLFAAVPVGLAFRLGSRINPTMNPEVVTYQFDAKRSPRYKKAIVLGAPPAIPEAKTPAIAPIVWRGNEALTESRETFLDLWFFHEGLRIAQSVVRLEVITQNGLRSFGTGFLIASNTVLTNHHVLYDDEGRAARRVAVVFHDELDRTGQLCKPDVDAGDVETIQGEKSHDWAIVRLKKPRPAEYPALTLRPSKHVAVGDFAYIIQHPEGRRKMIALHHNNVVFVDGDRVQYKTDTLRGSSGSPVCNEFWEVIALHRQWEEELVEGEKKYRNEGTNIERVVEGLKARGIIE